jgi:hypothetical protein
VRRAFTRSEIFVSVAVLGLAAWLLVPALGASRIHEQRQRCLDNLSTIGRGLSAYLDANEHRWPFAAKLRTTQQAAGKGWPLLPAVLQP